MAPLIAHTPLSELKIPYIANVSGQLMGNGSSADHIRRNLVAQIESPVQWVRSMDTLLDSGVNKAYELGPGVVLTNLLKRYSKSRSVEIELISISDEKGIEQL